MKNEQPHIETLTTRSHLAAGKDQTVDVLVRVMPPAMDESSNDRPKLNLSLVLDRSGSMQGEKMRQAKEAAKYCVDQLLHTDRIGSVIFDDHVDVLIPSQTVENREMLKRAINSVHTAGSTALHEAWVRGGLQVSEHLDPAAINRVLLITDGQANVGETDTDSIVSQAGRLAENCVSTSTIGIGEDFNEDLLMPMAEAGQGNAWHVQEPQDMVRIFETELQGLVSQFGSSVTLGIKTANGVKVADVLNDFEVDGSGRYKMPNLRAGAPIDVVVRLRVPARAAGETDELAVFDVSYIAQHSKLPETVRVSWTAQFAAAGEVAALPENVDVVKAIQLLMNARARREAIELMDRQDYAGAQVALKMVSDSTHVLYSRAPSEDIGNELHELDQLNLQLADRSCDVSSRKQMAYRRENLRKGR